MSSDTPDKIKQLAEKLQHTQHQGAWPWDTLQESIKQEWYNIAKVALQFNERDLATMTQERDELRRVAKQRLAAIKVGIKRNGELREALKMAKRELLDENSNQGTREEVIEHVDACALRNLHLIHDIAALREENDELRRDRERLQDDVGFLINRSGSAGRCSFSKDRDTGMSSNSIVAIAYGKTSLADQVLPGDRSDLNACELAFSRLPDHRKTEEAQMAFNRARAAIQEDES